MTRIVFGVLAALALAVSCGQEAAKPSPTFTATPTPLKVLAAEYTQLVAPANSALGAVASAQRARCERDHDASGLH